MDKRTPLDRLRAALRPTRWLAATIFLAGAAVMVLNTADVWAEAWLHHTQSTWVSVIGIAAGVFANVAGARLYYLATDYKQYVAIRDKALAVVAEVDSFLKPLAEARGRGAEVVGVVVREFGETHVVYDDEPRVIN